MTVMSPAGSRLYSVLLATGEERPGTWLTVAAADLVDAMKQARETSWWGDSVPAGAESARVAAVECLGLAWH